MKGRDCFWDNKRDKLLREYAINPNKARVELANLFEISIGAIRNRERILGIIWTQRDMSGKNNPMWGKKRPDFREHHWTKVGYSQSGSKNPAWKGGRFKNGGYFKVLISEKKYELEHRLVMEKFLGRKLEPNEIVHHKDKNKSNNDISNLELLDNQSKHLKEHWSKGKLFDLPFKDERKRNKK